MSFLAGCAGLLGFALAAVARTVKAGRPPFASMYEFGLLVVLALALLWLVLELKGRYWHFGPVLLPTILILAGVVLLFFQEPRPLMPALQSAWLVAHVMTAVVAYGLLAASFGLALAWLVRTRNGSRQGGEATGSELSGTQGSGGTGEANREMTGLPPAQVLWLTLDRMVSLAFPFLTLLIITGAIWAQYAWGSFWRWDPKETWALITWLLYLVYLHGTRIRKWRERTAVWFAAAGFVVVLFTFFGVNLLLAGLHSYM